MVTNRACVVCTSGQAAWRASESGRRHFCSRLPLGPPEVGAEDGLALPPLFLIQGAQGLTSLQTLDEVRCLQRGESSMR